MHRTLRAVAVAALAVGLVVGPAAVASAAPVQVAAAEDDFTPSKSKFRKHMINVTSSLLGSAAPKAWQREAVANRYAAGGFPSGDELNKMFGYTELVTDPVTGNLRPAAPVGSGTYDDVVIQEQEKLMNKTSKRKRLAVPATAAKEFAKAVGAGTAVYLAWEFGVSLGKGVSGLMGLDANGLMCAGTFDQYGDVGLPITDVIMGTDCDAWRMHNEYLANQDAESGYAGTQCYAGQCVQVHGINTGRRSSSDDTEVRDFCVSYDPARPGGANSEDNGVRVQYVRPSGQGTSSSGWLVNGFCRDVYPGSEGYGLALWAAPFVAEMPTIRMTAASGVEEFTPEDFRYQEDPVRTFECTLTYTDGSTEVAVSLPYQESSGVVSPIVCPNADEEKVVENVSIRENGSGSTHELYDEDTTEEYKDWLEKYPECVSGICLLDLLFVKPGTTDKWGSCFDLQDGCPGWFEDADKTSKYKCRYGTQEVDLEECVIYAAIFQPGRTEAGAPYTDPQTGVWSGGQNAAKAGQEAFREPLQDPDGAYRSCNGTTSAGQWDPIAFIMRPVGCALERAFVPRKTVVDVAFGAANSQWATKAPAMIASAVGNVAVTAPGDGCSVPVSVLGVSGDIVNVCEGPMSALPVFTRLVTSAVIVIIVWNLVRRQIAGYVGYSQGQG